MTQEIPYAIEVGRYMGLEKLYHLPVYRRAMVVKVQSVATPAITAVILNHAKLKDF